MSKRIIPVLVLLLLAGLFVTYGVRGNGDKMSTDPTEKYQRILRNVGIVLEQGHYSPKKIDDNFSKEALANFQSALDGDKVIFMAADIKNFQKYADRIDDEIHGAPIKSFYDITETYLKRFDEFEALYKRAFTEPMDFKVKEYLQTDGDKRDYPSNNSERYDFVRKRAKYQVLIRYANLLEERDSAKMEKPKSDSALLKEAIEAVSKQMDRYFSTTRTHNTTDELFSTFVNAITSTMDPHTNYMAPIDKRTFDEMLSGKFYGIGAQLRETDGQIKVLSLVTGSPSWKSGEIKPDDIIIKVGQGDQPPVDITSYALPDAVKLIRGSTKGSEVRLTLKKPDGTVKVVSLLRDEINLDDVFAKSAIIEGEHKLGYIFLPEFYADFENPAGRRSSTDMAIEVQKLKDANVDGIIIDLRGNGGGSLQDVVDMVGLFVKRGPVVQVKGRGERASILDSREKEPVYTGPLVVMVNEQSASASEIFAAAIQDYHRGIVIGSTSTFGKGTVQRSVSLDPQSQNFLFNRSGDGLGDVKLTFRKFYRIDGGATQLRGVVPDIIIPDALENAKIREKDTRDALGWDTIAKARYALWNPGYSFHNIIKEATAEIGENPNFEGIRTVVEEIDSFQNMPAPLQLKEYKEMQVKSRQLSKKLNEYSKLDKHLNVSFLPQDIQNVAGDSIKIKSQEQFKKVVAGDLYVSETVSVLDKLIGERLVAMRAGELRETQE